MKEICDALDAFQQETGIDVPVDVDGASGAIIAPFVDPMLEWDFQLSRVASINTSGHKYGSSTRASAGSSGGTPMNSPGPDLLGELSRRQHADLRVELLAAGSQVVAQYYIFLRLGFDGYRRAQAYARTSPRLRRLDCGAGPFELLTRGDELPVFAFRLKDDVAE